MKTYTYKYPMPCVTTDVLIFGYDVKDKELRLLLIERKEDPFADHWALPGGHIKMNETLEQTALRELKEETGITGKDVHVEQLFTFGNPGRDPRGRYITVAYLALVDLSSFPKAKAGSDAKSVLWASISRNDDCRRVNLGTNLLAFFDKGEFIVDEAAEGLIAFDHIDIIGVALSRLASKAVYQPVIFNVLPKEFSLTTLQEAYEVVLDRDLDKRNFRKKILSMKILKSCKQEEGTAHRPATLYRFDKEAFWAKKDNGFFFEL